MPSIVYGGLRYTQVRHAIYCKNCKETIESKHVHDFKYCSCKAVGIDGGISAGNRILGNLSDMEDRSMYCIIIQNKKVWLPQTVIEERFLRIQNQNIFPMAETSARIPTREPVPESA
jgi:hypothetical protein